jgi:WD40 repeat protein
LLRLITLGEEGSEDTRRRVLRTELASVEVDGQAMEQAVDVFGNARLLSFDRDPSTRGPTVEVAHEALLREWGRLRGWVEAAREDVRVHRRLVAAAADWTAADRDPSFLLRGSRLQLFESWAGTSGLALTGPERRYLEESVAQREAEAAAEETRKAKERTLERRSVIRLRALVAVLAVLALVAGSLTLVAFNQRGRARQQSRIAFARELAAAAAANLDVDPERSVLLATQAVRTYRSAGVPPARDAVEALHSAVQASRAVLTLVHPSSANVAWSADGRLIATGGTFTGQGQNEVVLWDARTGRRMRTFTGHAGDIDDVNFSRDGSRLVSVGGAIATSVARATIEARRGDWTITSAVIVWDPRTGEQQLSLPTVIPVWAARFSPDGSRIATTGFGGGSIWDASTGQLVRSMQAESIVCGMAWSPEGTRIAAASCSVAETAAVSVWDVRTGQRELTIRGRQADGVGVAFSPNGRLIATGGVDGTAAIWDAASGRRLHTLRGHTGEVLGGLFSPDGAVLATHGYDGAVRLWDVDTGRQLMVLAGHRGPVGDVTWSPDGSRLLTGGADGTARIWDVTVQGSREWLTLAGHTDQVRSVQYSPDGTSILTSSSDGTARLWDASSGSEVGRFTDPNVGDAAVFSPDGSRVLTSGPPPVLWDRSGRQIRTMKLVPGDEFRFPSTAFAPDGKVIAVGGVNNGRTILWDVSTGRPIQNVYHHEGWVVWGVAFSPDGSLLGTADALGTAQISDFRSGYAVARLKGHESDVHSIDFSPDGRLVVTGSADGTARVWDVPSGRLRLTLRGHSASVSDATFSPDGKLIATAGGDNTARLWDTSTGREVLKLTGDALGLTAVAFSPDGSRLATASGDGTVRVYALRLDDLMKLAAERVTRNLTGEECRIYLHLERCPPG